MSDYKSHDHKSEFGAPEEMNLGTGSKFYLSTSQSPLCLQYIACCASIKDTMRFGKFYNESQRLNQELLLELVAQGIVKGVKVSETTPSKGKALRSIGRTVWVVTVILKNGKESCLMSTRGSQREWASLDRLTEWLRTIGICKYHVSQLESQR